MIGENVRTEESWKRFCKNHEVIETTKEDPEAIEHEGKYYKPTVSGHDIGPSNVSKTDYP